MISWPITFTTYNGEQLTETFMFNLSKAELIKMQFDVNGAFSQYIERITNERNLKQLGEEFTKLILNSYGKKSDDGRHFYKSEELRNEFAQSEAYSELLVQLLSDSDAAARFMKGILPADLQAADEETPKA
jgi:hypothetical protein